MKSVREKRIIPCWQEKHITSIINAEKSRDADMTEPFMAKSRVKTKDVEKKRHTQKEQAAPEWRIRWEN